MTRVRVSEQVETYVKALAPAPRKAVRSGIKGLAEDQGDVKHLEADLLGWSRLRVAHHRVLFKECFVKGVRTIDCVYANRRSVVYDLFAQLLKDQLLKEG